MHEGANLTVVGTADFIAPEIVAGEKYDEKVDVYSFGIVMAEIATCVFVLKTHGQMLMAKTKKS